MSGRQRILFIIGVLSSLVACKPEHGIPDGGRRQLEKAQQKLDKPDLISFEDVYSLVLRDRCVKCHSKSRREANVDLTTYENALGRNGFQKTIEAFDPQRSSLFNTLISAGNRMMPPSGEASLEDDFKTLIYQWINNGAKKTADSKPLRPPSLQERLRPYFDRPEMIDYDVVNEQVFQQHCFRCHSSESDEAEDDTLLYSADLTNYASIFNPFNPVVEKGKPSDSSIYRSIGVEQSMPPAKDGFLPLDSLLVKLARLWILNCAIENFDPEAGEEFIEDQDNPDKRRRCQP